MIVAQRRIDATAHDALIAAGIAPFFARLYASRGVASARELEADLNRLLPPSLLLHADRAAGFLADAISADRRLCIVADYDCDGATACAVAVRGLRMLGARHVDYIVPNRFEYGYGLTPEIVALARERRKPDVIVTVDNGIASLDGVAAANRLGIDVVITDHHLPAAHLPEAACIVNPNQPGCGFPSKHLAGVGVMFYVLFALRAELRRRGVFDQASQPRLDRLLDLVALGTVADVVRLDANNRLIVAKGLERIRSGRMQPGVAALFRAAGRDPARASAFDFGFALGPRINAAGRLADMTLGIECLLTDDAARAGELAVQLDTINRERREVEAGMRELAEATLNGLSFSQTPPAVTLFDERFHEGVVGIVAGRVKDKLHRPTFVFARGAGGQLKGSGRSIAGFHLRDALDLMAKRQAGLLLRFGGHAMAAGCTLADGAVTAFEQAFAQVAAEWLDSATLTRQLRTDGPLAAEWFDARTVALLDAQVWGQGFEAPLFCDEVQVLQQRLVGEKHLKLRLRHAGQLRDAIWFGRTEPLPATLRLAFRLVLDEYNGQQRVQMVIEAEG
ncbi:MAG: single-stranded-DNA-specific exonuclease RecJ [Chitinophagaceae bacterium]|nr:single-stranded-DNA-specific exonuclease RecJ [Rubrivivax sp.]